MSRIVSDAVVIGGGAIGTAAAYFLSTYGFKPVLVDQAHLNAGASGACDEGIILQSKNPGIALDMVIKSASLYQNLTDALDYDIGYRNIGGMILVKEESHLPVIESIVQNQQKQGLRIRLLDKADTHQKQAQLSPEVIASAYSEDDCSVNPFKLTAGYVTAARKKGALLLLHQKVEGIGVHKQRVTKVLTQDHEILTPLVVDASGCNSRKLGKLVGLDIPSPP